jgi:hypothetical protein
MASFEYVAQARPQVCQHSKHEATVLAAAVILVGCLGRTSAINGVFTTRTNPSNTARDDQHPRQTRVILSVCRSTKRDPKNEKHSGSDSARLAAQLVGYETKPYHTDYHAEKESVGQASVYRFGKCVWVDGFHEDQDVADDGGIVVVLADCEAREEDHEPY